MKNLKKWLVLLAALFVLTGMMSCEMFEDMVIQWKLPRHYIKRVGPRHHGVLQDPTLQKLYILTIPTGILLIQEVVKEVTAILSLSGLIHQFLLIKESLMSFNGRI
ncbi:MAG: hypothetical protein B6241_13700 [Spirochaetaceae bacterium 4572_59]|nr:MAG: hypothetical protein B6241_13700 [Spirochaetaceae bacterium 4572_59]